jgi:hypothetical protein
VAKGKGNAPKPTKETTGERNNGKAFKKHPKRFDKTKRRLVNAK